EVIADDVGLAVAEPRQPGVLIPADRRAQLRRDRAARIRITEQLAEHLLAGADRAARALAGDPAAAQRLVRPRWHAERLGERDPAAAVRHAHAFVERERFRTRGGDIGGLVGRERALAGLGHEPNASTPG